MSELNVANRTLFIRDNVDILDNLNSECADLIYLDPPFNSNRSYAAPIGSKAAGAAFKDAWTLDDIDLGWVGYIADKNPPLAGIINAVGKIQGAGRGDKAYLIFMARRLLEMHRILKPDGSIYLHCDCTMSHGLKMVMDSIFGKARFRNEIIWSYNRFSRRGGAFPAMNDIILFYGKSGKMRFNKLPVAARDETRYQKGHHTVVDGGVRRLLVYNRRKAAARIADAEACGMEVVYTKAESPAMGNVWKDIPIINPMAKERTGYPTQKPLALLRRIIKASSDEGDVVLDPFCGCATALVAAEQLNRRWVGIDIARKAKDLIKARLQDAQDMLTAKSAWREVVVDENAPARTDMDGREKIKTAKEKRDWMHFLYGAQNGLCAGCGREFEFRNMELDHIKAKKKGGQDIKRNTQLLCGSCNRIKGDRGMDYLIGELKRRGILNGN